MYTLYKVFLCESREKITNSIPGVVGKRILW
jgi:hypothetical protein